MLPVPQTPCLAEGAGNAGGSDNDTRMVEWERDIDIVRYMGALVMGGYRQAASMIARRLGEVAGSGWMWEYQACV